MRRRLGLPLLHEGNAHVLSIMAAITIERRRLNCWKICLARRAIAGRLPFILPRSAGPSGVQPCVRPTCNRRLSMRKLRSSFWPWHSCPRLRARRNPNRAPKVILQSPDGKKSYDLEKLEPRTVPFSSVYLRLLRLRSGIADFQKLQAAYNTKGLQTSPCSARNRRPPATTP